MTGPSLDEEVGDRRRHDEPYRAPGGRRRFPPSPVWERRARRGAMNRTAVLALIRRTLEKVRSRPSLVRLRAPLEAYRRVNSRRRRSHDRGAGPGEAWWLASHAAATGDFDAWLT